MKKLRTLVRDGALLPRLLFVTVWMALFVYAGRPLLVAAAAGGIAPALAWSGLIGLAFLPLLPLVIPRSLTHWIGYATLGLFSTLLVMSVLTDVVRIGL